MPASNVLKVALVGGPMYDGLYERIPEFERAAGFRVEIMAQLPHPALNDRLERDFGEGAAQYDLISTHTKYAPSQTHYLLPLDPYFSAQELAVFSPRMLDHARLDGRLMGIPRNIDVKLLYYRRDLFESEQEKAEFRRRFGRALRAPETWEELRDAAVFFTRPPELYGFVFPGRYSGLFGHFFELHAMAGGRLFDDRLSAVFAGDAGRWALGFLTDMYARAAPRETPEWHYDEVTRCFLEGKAAMTTDWPGSYHLFRNPKTSRVVGKFGVALYPAGPAGKRAVYSGGFTWAIPTSVRHLEGALALLRFLASEDSQFLEASHGAICARTKVQRRIRAQAPPGSLDAERLDLLETTVADYMLVPPQFVAYPLVEDTIWTTLQAAIVGRIPVDDALRQAVIAINQITGSAGETTRGAR